MKWVGRLMLAVPSVFVCTYMYMCRDIGWPAVLAMVVLCVLVVFWILVAVEFMCADEEGEDATKG